MQLLEHRHRRAGGREDAVPGVGADRHAAFLPRRQARLRRHAFVAAHAQCLELACAHVGQPGACAVEHHLDPAAQHVDHARRAALVVDGRDLDAGRLREHLAGQVLGRAHAVRGPVHLARVGLGIGDELGHRVGRKLFRSHQDVGHLGDQRDGRDLPGIEGRALDGQRCDRRGAGCRQQQRVAVGGRLGHHVGTQRGAGAGAVLHVDRRVQLLPHGIGDQAGEDVGLPARRVGHDDADGLAGEVLRHGANGHGQHAADSGRGDPETFVHRLGSGLVGAAPGSRSGRSAQG